MLAGLALASVALGARNLRRSGQWARRFAAKPLWQPIVRLVPAALLVMLPDLLGRGLGGGRDLNFTQLAYYTLPLVIWAAVVATTNLSVLIVRASALLRERRCTAGHTAPAAPVEALAG